MLDFLLKHLRARARVRKRRGSRRLCFFFERLEARQVFSGPDVDIQLLGTKFYDSNGNGQRDGDEPGLSGWKIFLDDNNNEVLDPVERSTTTDQQGNYQFTLPAYSGAVVREEMQPGWQQIFPSTGSHRIGGVIFGVFDGLDFGNRISDPSYFSTIRGVVWHDQNHDAARDSSEPGLSGWQIYLDQNDNAVLDTGERWTYTDSNGSYQFGNVVPMNYVVREVTQAGWTQSFPSTGKHTVAAGARDVIANVDFGNYISQSGDIRGSKWSDANGNGLRDNNESGLAGWLIYLDQNLNGQQDSNERFTTTDADGNYSFSEVPLGRQVIGEAMPNVWRQQFPNKRVGFSPAALERLPFAPLNVGAAAEKIQAVDLGGNGGRDLVAFDRGRGIVAILNNLGAGRFESPQDIFVGRDVQFALTGDVDGDRDADLVTLADEVATNQHPRQIRIDTRRNNGDGSFSLIETTVVAGILDYGSLADVDQNGRLDVVLSRYLNADDLGTQFAILLNDGSGEFTLSDNRILPEVASGAVVTLDFNGDGFVDRVVADGAQNQLAFFRNQGNGQFFAPAFLQAGQRPIFIVAGDLNRDGFRDLIVTNRDGGDVSVFLNNRNGTFAPEQRFGSGLGSPSSAALADLDGDSALDLTVVNGDVSDLAIFFNNGSGSFGTSTSYAVGASPSSVTTGDVDRDNDIDLIIANGAANSISVLLNDGAGLFTASGDIGVGSTPSFVTSGLVNGDLYLDLVVTTSDGKQELLNNGDGTFGAAQPFLSDRLNRSFSAADMTGDGAVDLLSPSDLSRFISLRKNNGQGFYFESQPIEVDGRSHFVVTGDWNGDGKNDFVTSYLDSNRLGVYLNSGTGTFSAGTSVTLGQTPSDIVTGDLDGDGDLDLAISSAAGGIITILSNNGSGVFGSPVDMPAAGTGSVATGDLNDDGHLDLTTSLSGNELGVLLNDLTPNFRQRVEVTPGGTFPGQDFGNQKLSWKNSAKPLDVDDDSFIAPLDALIIINYLNRFGSQLLASQTPFAKPYLDPSGDDFIAPNDALMIINYLNRLANPEGEASDFGGAIATTTATTKNVTIKNSTSENNSVTPPTFVSFVTAAVPRNANVNFVTGESPAAQRTSAVNVPNLAAPVSVLVPPSSVSTRSSLSLKISDDDEADGEWESLVDAIARDIAAN